MRILFYLPVVTPLWFERVVVPMIRTLRPHAELHVLVPALWRNTGVARQHLAKCADLTDIHWHIVEGPGHESLRDAPDDREGLIGFVQSLAPDHVLCRVAETETVARFPGKIHHILEAGSPPLRTIPFGVILQPLLFENGAIPALTSEQAAGLDAQFAPRWEAAQQRRAKTWPFDLPRAEALALLDLPSDRRIIAVPLEYDHEENFYWVQHRFRENIDLVSHLLDSIPDDFLLAFTNHPLNVAHGRDAALRAELQRLGRRVHIVSAPDPDINVTDLLVRHCDGMIVQNSKSYSVGALFGKPVLRLSHCPSAEWLRTYEDLDTFLAALGAGSAVAADPEAVRRWFAYRIADESFDAETIGAADLLARLDNRISPGRWETGFARYDQYQTGR
ncbi:hypothetical protein ACMGDH_02005 [Sphingomonas sp. DT-207]|uniref:hypothetical protein n=1 Tax=Sphingomonas sp. DT-207 TaxID=3396167 RepID=UPI003F1AE11D